MSAFDGVFNRSTQHLLILLEEEVCDGGDCTDMVRRAWERALRPKLCRLARHARLRWRVAQKLALQWSPQLTKHVRKLPQQLRRSLTWDRGKEMADHKSFTVATNVQSPWQRGSNENTNGLLRQYFPRGTDLSRFLQDYLNKITRRLNQRPRKTLGFETPADRLQAVLQ